MFRQSLCIVATLVFSVLPARADCALDWGTFQQLKTDRILSTEEETEQFPQENILRHLKDPEAKQAMREVFKARDAARRKAETEGGMLWSNSFWKLQTKISWSKIMPNKRYCD